MRGAVRRLRAVADPSSRAERHHTRELGQALSLVPGDDSQTPEQLRTLRRGYEVADDIALRQGAVPLMWWADRPNFGDMLSPWLVGMMTRRPVVYASGHETNYVGIGSVINRAGNNSHVWGSGAFSTEDRRHFNRHAVYHAVRGPLTRSRLLNVGLSCARVYGDPALLIPLYHWPVVTKSMAVGIVLRHTESRWRESLASSEDILMIDLASGSVTKICEQILSCEVIVSSSLHGLILADAYGIPSIWLDSDEGVGGSRPNGGEFKFYDYFASVDKFRKPVALDITASGSASELLSQASADPAPIDFDHAALLDACPFLQRANGTAVEAVAG